MKKIDILLILLMTILTITGCSDQLNVTPKGRLADELLLGKPEHIDGFVTPCYAIVPNFGFADSHAAWIHGSIRSDDAYKGGSTVGDQQCWHDMEVFSTVTPTIANNDGPWFMGYFANSRYGLALRALDLVTNENYPLKDTRIGEVKFLRGATYFTMKTIWRYLPWIDEVTGADMELVEQTGNRPNGTDDMYLWENILADLEDAVLKLPEVQDDKGRINKNAARAMAAKVLLFMAYEQNERHQVVNINKQRLEKALIYLNQLTDQEGTTVDLCEDFADNFLPEYDNATKESLWEIQYSINDGMNNGGRINWGTELNSPSWSPYFACCDFHKASFNLANAFRTDANGLPLFDTFNDAELKNNYENYFNNNTFDPRISHTMAIPGHPFKYDPDLVFDSIGSRNPADYGYLKSVKELVHPDCDCVLKPGYVQNSMNERKIRYSEVLLWKAEILIQLDRHAEARPLINQVRERAANSTVRLKKKDGTPYLDYNVALYPNDATWTKDYAWKALMFENRLETACEGRRFFDLLRWGILEETMNAYFAKERNRYSWMNNAIFVAGRDEYKPISQAQMLYARGVYTQNPGY